MLLAILMFSAALKKDLFSTCAIAIATLSAVTVFAAPPSSNAGSGDVDIVELRSLYFGTIAPDTFAAGTVEIRPNRDGFSRCGHPLLCLEGGTRGQFQLSSSRSQFINIAVSEEAILTNPVGDQLWVTDFSLKGSKFTKGRGRINANKPETIGIGATLHVAPNQPPGHYRGIYDVTIIYE